MDILVKVLEIAFIAWAVITALFVAFIVVRFLAEIFANIFWWISDIIKEHKQY